MTRRELIQRAIVGPLVGGVVAAEAAEAAPVERLMLCGFDPAVGSEAVSYTVWWNPETGKCCKEVAGKIVSTWDSGDHAAYYKALMEAIREEQRNTMEWKEVKKP